MLRGKAASAYKVPRYKTRMEKLEPVCDLVLYPRDVSNRAFPIGASSPTYPNAIFGFVRRRVRRRFSQGMADDERVHFDHGDVIV